MHYCNASEQAKVKLTMGTCPSVTCEMTGTVKTSIREPSSGCRSVACSLACINMQGSRRNCVCTWLPSPVALRLVATSLPPPSTRLHQTKLLLKRSIYSSLCWTPAVVAVLLDAAVDLVEADNRAWRTARQSPTAHRLGGATVTSNGKEGNYRTKRKKTCWSQKSLDPLRLDQPAKRGKAYQ